MPDDWSPFDDGATLGQTGSEGGIILRDEEHLLGARITLEQGGRIALFSVTFGVYGLLTHTRFFGTQTEGEREYTSCSRNWLKLLMPVEKISTRQLLPLPHSIHETR